ncbi:hypothetical protein ACFX12_046650 [Malus domestica]
MNNQAAVVDLLLHLEHAAPSPSSKHHGLPQPLPERWRQVQAATAATRVSSGPSYPSTRSRSHSRSFTSSSSPSRSRSRSMEALMKKKLTVAVATPSVLRSLLTLAMHLSSLLLFLIWVCQKLP